MPQRLDADAIIRVLGLRPHPEGGHYVETWRAASGSGERSRGTAIHYLLRAGEQSRWHRVDADEIWNFHGGDALELSTAPGDGAAIATRHRLGMDLLAGERPQINVPAGDWQQARSLGAWTLVGCTVVPGFRFEGFELAEVGWQPGQRRRAGGS